MSNFAKNKFGGPSFVVKNISSIGRTVKVFGQKIYSGQQVDLFAIPGVSADDISASYLKGDLGAKLANRTLQIISSNIDLAQLNFGKISAISNMGISSGAQQASWYIDSVNGNDGNTGASSSAALKTLTEFFSRINGIEINIAMTVNVLTSMLSTDFPKANIIFGTSGSLLVKGTTTTLYSGTATTRTNIARATNVPPDLTDSALPSAASWTGYAAHGTRVKTLTGASTVGAVAWPIKDLGTKKARLSNWLVPDATIATYLLSGIDISTNDPYKVELLPSVYNCYISIVADENFSFIPRLVFQDIYFVNNCSFFNSSTSGSAATAAIYGCDVSAANFFGSWTCVNCRFSSPAISSGCVVDIYAGANIGTFNINGGDFNFDFGFINQGGLGIAVNDGAGFIADLGVFDSTDNAISFNGNSPLYLAPFFGSFALWGSGSSKFGCRVRGGVVIPFTSFTGATITGTSGNVGVSGGAGTAKTWGACPAIVSNIAAGVGTTLSGVVLY